jgi:hypothetical protein
VFGALIFILPVSHFLSQKLKIRRALSFSYSFPKKERKEEQMEEITSKFMKKKKTLFIARMNKVFELSAIVLAKSF